MSAEPASVIAAKAAAARINALLQAKGAASATPAPPTGLAIATAAAAKINALLAAKGLSNATEGPAKTFDSPAQQLWPWQTRDTSEEAAPIVLDEKAGDGNVCRKPLLKLFSEEYKQLAGLTLKGLRKLGYTGGPVMGEKEAIGARFGLHRAGFKPKSEFKSIKLLVGLEVDACAQLAFPVLERLRGPGSSNLIYIMRQCPGSMVAVNGRGTNTLTEEEPLHLKIAGTSDQAVQAAQVLADSLIATVKQGFDAHHARLQSVKDGKSNTVVRVMPPVGVPILAAPLQVAAPLMALNTTPPILPTHGVAPLAALHVTPPILTVANAPAVEKRKEPPETTASDHAAKRARVSDAADALTRSTALHSKGASPLPQSQNALPAAPAAQATNSTQHVQSPAVPASEDEYDPARDVSDDETEEKG